MNYLTAALAFSAIMIVLATLVTVIVEAVHGVLSRRKHDFEHMLKQLYEKEIKPKATDILKDNLEQTDKFIKDLVTNPAIAPAKKGKLDWIFPSKTFDELTTRQFVEQFRDTQVGQKLLQKNDQNVDIFISNIAYEFERYGQAASKYFQKKAAVLSILAALILIVTLNVDAILLFEKLSNDNDLSKKIIAEINIDDFEKEFIDRAEKLSPSELETINVEFNQAFEKIKDEVIKLEEYNLPLGSTYFPWCLNSTAEIDVRCESLINQKLSPENTFWESVKITLLNFLSRIPIIFTTLEGGNWLLRMVLTTALIGLGAPFWFKTYRFIAQFVPGHRQPEEDSLTVRQSSQQTILQNHQIPLQTSPTTKNTTSEEVPAFSKAEQQQKFALQKGLTTRDLKLIFNRGI